MSDKRLEMMLRRLEQGSAIASRHGWSIMPSGKMHVYLLVANRSTMREDVFQVYIGECSIRPDDLLETVDRLDALTKELSTRQDFQPLIDLLPGFSAYANDYTLIRPVWRDEIAGLLGMAIGRTPKPTD